MNPTIYVFNDSPKDASTYSLRALCNDLNFDLQKKEGRFDPRLRDSFIAEKVATDLGACVCITAAKMIYLGVNNAERAQALVYPGCAIRFNAPYDAIVIGEQEI